MGHDQLCRNAHARQVQHGGGDAEEHDGQQLAEHDFAARGGAAQQRFQRAALLFAGAEIDGRIECSGQRPEQHQDRQDFRPQAPLRYLASATSDESTENGRIADTDTPLLRRLSSLMRCVQRPSTSRSRTQRDPRLVVGRVVQRSRGWELPAARPALRQLPGPPRRPRPAAESPCGRRRAGRRNRAGSTMPPRTPPTAPAHRLGPRVGRLAWRCERSRPAEPNCNSSSLALSAIVGKLSPFSNKGGTLRPVRFVGPDHQDSRRPLLHELGNLEQAHPQQRIEQHRAAPRS